MLLNENEKDFFVEWESAATNCTASALEILRQLECGEEVISHVASLRIYPRIPYLCAAWIESATERRELGISVALHCIGLKLLDDFADGDTNIAAVDLVSGGHLITQAATERYFDASGGDLLVQGTIECWLPAARHVRQEIHMDMNGLDEWLAATAKKALLPLYIGVLYQKRQPHACEALETAFTLIVTLGQIVDDWNDRNNAMETSNLIVLIKDGRASHDAAREWVVNARRLIFAIFDQHPPKLAISPFVEGLADRAIAALEKSI